VVRHQTDAVVVGGGTAGCVVAGRLVEAGLRVTVLEAGPDYGPVDSGRWPEDLLHVSASLPVGHDWGYLGRGAGAQELAFERARVIGGCSSHNGCGLSVGWWGDYDRWAAAGCSGWSVARWIKTTHAHYWHPAGTCRMGADDDAGAVVDAAGSVHGADGLHVADASVFPDIPRSTPALPTVVVGERIADAILAEGPSVQASSDR
jgi:choline dehydrogenase-like flavoprotein